MLTLSHANSSGTRLHRHGFVSLLVSLQNACSRLADAVNGSEHDRYIALAMEREPTTHSSLNMLRWAVLADSEPMPTRLVRDYLACNR